MVRFTLLFLFLSANLLAQKVDERLLAKARKLSEKHKDAAIAILNSHSAYTFQLENKTHQLHARHEENVSYIAIQPNSTFVKRNYYNDKLWIEDYSIRSDRGKKYDYDKFCGHYESDDIFYSDAQVCAYKFSMGMQGQGVTFKATTIFSDPRYLTKIFFHDDVPVGKREITITVPDWAEIELLEINFDNYNIQKKVSQGHNTTYTYILEDIESMPEDDHAPGYLHFLPHILVLTKSYEHKSVKIPVLASTDDLYAWYYTLTHQLGHETDQIRTKVEALTKGLTTDLEKIKAIYYWVQDNIKYIAFENGLAAFKPEEADKVFYNRYGDCKGMANLTKTMLKLAGFDARLTWIGTNIIPYSYDIPSLAVDNHMICTVYANGRQFILDPTEKYNPLGQHAERIQGKQILIEEGTHYRIDTVQEEAIEDYLRKNELTLKIKDGYLTGEGSTMFNGEYKKNLFNYMHNLTGEDVQQFLQAVISGSSNPDNFEVVKFSNPDRNVSFTVSYAMKLDNHVNRFDDELYLDLDFTEEFKDVKLKEERRIPFHFGRKQFRQTTTEINVPSGYRVSYLPKPFQIDNDYFKFDLKYELSNGKIVYSKEIKILKNTLPVVAFEEWNAAVDGIKNFYNDQIILNTDE